MPHDHGPAPPDPQKRERRRVGSATADLDKGSDSNGAAFRTTRLDPQVQPERREISRSCWIFMPWRDARHWELSKDDPHVCVERSEPVNKRDALDESLREGQHTALKVSVHCELYMPTLLKLAVGGELRPFVPFEPRWCRTKPDEFLSYLAAGKPLSDEQTYQLYDIEACAEKFREIGRIARRADGDE